MIGLSLPEIDHVALRHAISLSLATGRAFRLADGFRFVRENPVAGSLLADWENALGMLSAGSFGSDGDDLLFRPGTLKHGDYSFVTGAFSSALELVLLLIPPLTRLEYRSTLGVRGVTHSDLTYTTDFANITIFDLLERMGFYIHLSLKRFGFYGSGGGLLEAKAYPEESSGVFPALRYRDVRITGARVYIAKLPTDIAMTQREMLVERAGIPASAVGIVEVLDADGPGNFIQAYAECDGGVRIVQAASPVYSGEGAYIFSREVAAETARSAVEECGRLVAEKAVPERAVRELLPYIVLSGSGFSARAGGAGERLAAAFL
ncbi:MAG TPA: RNA 3'-terminal phosphate cyclase [Spirochaetota bacterium]|nr:RNA 3'-terminal phosphate cyclase [Spirochaetota bacterium]